MNSAAVTKSTQAVENEKSYERIAEIIERHRDREDSLIQVLHEAQEAYGYLPLELQRFISRGMDIPLAKVSGVVSFYSFVSTEPRGEHTIRVCMGTACYVRGGGKIVKHLRERLGVELGVEVGAQALEQRAVSCHQPGFEQRGLHGDVFGRLCQALRQGAHTGANLQAGIPAVANEGRDALAQRLLGLFGQQHQDIDIGIGEKLRPAIAAHGHQGQRAGQLCTLPQRLQQTIRQQRELAQ